MAASPGPCKFQAFGVELYGVKVSGCIVEGFGDLGCAVVAGSALRFM